MTKIILTLLFSHLSCFATEERETFLYMPLQINEKVVVHEIPAIVGLASPETEFDAISQPYKPLKISYNELPPENMNAISLANINISNEAQPNGTGYTITIDLKNAKHFNSQLLDAIVICFNKTAAGSYPLTFVLQNSTEYPDAQKWLTASISKKKPASTFITQLDDEQGITTTYFISTTTKGAVSKIRSIWHGTGEDKVMVYDYQLIKSQLIVTRSNAKQSELESLLNQDNATLNQLSSFKLTRNSTNYLWESDSEDKKLEAHQAKAAAKFFHILTLPRQPFSTPTPSE